MRFAALVPSQIKSCILAFAMSLMSCLVYDQHQQAKQVLHERVCRGRKGYLVIREEVSVVARDALLLGIRLHLLLLRNHHRHQEALQASRASLGMFHEHPLFGGCCC